MELGRSEYSDDEASLGSAGVWLHCAAEGGAVEACAADADAADADAAEAGNRRTDCKRTRGADAADLNPTGFRERVGSGHSAKHPGQGPFL